VKKRHHRGGKENRTTKKRGHQKPLCQKYSMARAANKFGGYLHFNGQEEQNLLHNVPRGLILRRCLAPEEEKKITDRPGKKKEQPWGQPKGWS